MLEKALAGDDQTLNNMFGFYPGYREHNKYSILDFRLPHQWEAINAMVKANPELFKEERFQQQEVKIEALERKINQFTRADSRLRTALSVHAANEADMHEPAGG